MLQYMSIVYNLIQEKKIIYKKKWCLKNIIKI